MLYAFVPLLIVLIGTGTYYRNQAWSTEWTLWEDARQKAPMSARPLFTLALLSTAEKNVSQEKLNYALALYFKSLELRISRKSIHAAILGNMASIYYRMNNLNAAIIMHRRALEKDPYYIQSRYNLSVLLNIQGKWDAAVAEIEKILSRGLVHQDYYDLKGLARLWQDRPEEALAQFRESIALAGDKTFAYMGIGSALSKLGSYRQANWFFRKAIHGQPDSIMVLFLLIDNAVSAGDQSIANKWTERLLATHALPVIESWLKTLPTYYRSPPVSVERIAPIIVERAKALNDRMIPTHMRESFLRYKSF